MTTNAGLQIVALAFLVAASQPAAGGDVEEPDGYRMDDYRSPVPETLRGAQVVTTAEAESLWRGGEVVFFDVMPQAPRPELPSGTIWRDKVRRDIPGSIWLANVGYGALPPETEDYFRRALAAHAGNASQTILFYCMADCWMSWNAARRAVEWGYSAVIWYPAGTNGWEEQGLPLAENKPYEPPAAKQTY